MLFGFSRIQCRHIPGFQRGVLPDGLPDSLRASGKGLHRYARHFPHTVLTDHFSFIAQRLNLLFQFFPVEPAKGNLISVHILNEPRFAGLSERKVQFTYTDVLARTVGILPPENGVIERALAGIDEAISREQLIPLDREKGLFTSGIHVLDELSVRALSRDIMKQNRVTVHPEKSVPRTAGYSDAVSVLAQDRPSLAIVSGQGGAAGQRERVAELVMMAREQGREVQIIAADRRSQMNLKQDERLSGELIWHTLQTGCEWSRLIVFTTMRQHDV